MKKKYIWGISILILLGLILALTGRNGIRSTFSSSKGYQHKRFGSSNSLDGKPLVLKKNGVYVFDVKAKMKEGSLSVTLLNKERDKELLKIEGNSINEIREIALEAGEYAVEIQTHHARGGEFTLRYYLK